MSNYLLGLLTIPAIAVSLFAIWFITVALWQEVLMPPRYVWRCVCGQQFGKITHRTEGGMKRSMKRHAKTCRKPDYYETEES